MIKEGDIFESSEDVEVICMTYWAAPFTGGGDVILPKGERVRVANNPAKAASAVYCDPLRYEELHEQMVSLKDRKNRKYTGYYFCIKLDALRAKFTRIENKGEQGGSGNA